VMARLAGSTTTSALTQSILDQNDSFFHLPHSRASPPARVWCANRSSIQNVMSVTDTHSVHGVCTRRQLMKRRVMIEHIMRASVRVPLSGDSCGMEQSQSQCEIMCTRIRTHQQTSLSVAAVVHCTRCIRN
jgi:hypothetical protein